MFRVPTTVECFEIHIPSTWLSSSCTQRTNFERCVFITGSFNNLKYLWEQEVFKSLKFKIEEKLYQVIICWTKFSSKSKPCTLNYWIKYIQILLIASLFVFGAVFATTPLIMVCVKVLVYCWVSNFCAALQIQCSFLILIDS